MTKKLENYLVNKIETLERRCEVDRQYIATIQKELEHAREFENKVLKLAKRINIVPAHVVEHDGKSFDIDEYVNMESFYRREDPELYDFVINHLKWDKDLDKEEEEDDF